MKKILALALVGAALMTAPAFGSFFGWGNCCGCSAAVSSCDTCSPWSMCDDCDVC